RCHARSVWRWASVRRIVREVLRPRGIRDFLRKSSIMSRVGRMAAQLERLGSTEEGKGISASCWLSKKCSGLRSALGACRPAPWRGDAVGWHVLGGDKGKLPRWYPCRGWHGLGRGRNRGYLGL